MNTWSKIGYGTWPLGGDFNGAHSYGKVNDDISKHALNVAFDFGVRIFDTSDMYGFGHVEKLLGEVFYERRDEIIIITKGGMLNNDGQQDFSEKYLLNSLVGSLRRLRTNHVDVYMLHSPPLNVLEDGKILSLLKELKSANWIKEYGISLAKPEDGFKSVNDYGFNVIEVNYNILDHRSKNSGLLSLCKERNIKTIIRTPLGQGILSGEFVYNNDVSDRRNKIPKERVNNQRRIFQRMIESLNSNSYSNAVNCLRFCLANNNITTIIPGMKTANEVFENVSSLFVPPLTSEELNKIDEIYLEEKL